MPTSESTLPKLELYPPQSSVFFEPIFLTIHRRPLRAHLPHTANPTGAPTRNSGHFVVGARRASSGQIVYLDPGGGVIREVVNNTTYPTNGLVEEVLFLSI